MDHLGGKERLVGRKVMAATTLTIALSTAMFVNRPLIFVRSLAAPFSNGAAPAGHHDRADDSLAHPGASRLAPRRAGPHGLTPPDAIEGTRHRLVATSRPPLDDDTPFQPPAIDGDLFALHGPITGNPATPDFGVLYRLRGDRQYFLPLTRIGQNDRLPLVWLHASPAPEPATWISLIAGIALIGTALRRSRSALADSSTAATASPPA